MNLVELYHRNITFPFHKILNWCFEVQTRREVAPIYSFGDTSPMSFTRGQRTTSKEAHLTMVGLSDKEARRIKRMQLERKNISDFKLDNKEASIYINKGYIKHFGADNPALVPDIGTHYDLIIECEEVAVSADPPVSGFERDLRIGSMPTIQPLHIHHSERSEPRGYFLSEDVLRREYLGTFVDGNEDLRENNHRSRLDSLVDSARRLFGPGSESQ